MRQVSVADVTEEEAAVLQVHRLGLCRFPVQFLLQTQRQSLVAVLGVGVKAWADVFWRVWGKVKEEERTRR